jgi:hypothetical protein
MTDVTQWTGGGANSVKVTVLMGGSVLTDVSKKIRQRIPDSKPVVLVVVPVARVTVSIVTDVFVTVFVRVANTTVLEKLVFV